MADHMFVLRRRPAPFQHTLVLLLGLLAVMAGILAMHTLGVAHQAAPGHAAMASGQDASHEAGGSHESGSHDSHAGTPHATGSLHTVQGAVDAAALTAGQDLHSATCSGPCGGEHTMQAACVFLVVLTGWLLAFLRQRHHGSGGHGLRAPPSSLTWIRAVPRPPSLIELSVSRT
ncbi:hypothetical protein [Arthrobacter mangrovi]|uniref:DUF2946 domain-containing protein n=1 Tax=Arthrobacter mangrovi TaxID=2966350 RepID=A0ABQ5MZ68_9MICC|nr:hypothetical protein [Arthrobacter mangrovi]GLB69286.1 hypothetical protein AHIS1636_37290 [Arthrobacter mangrovi]